jgi:undecaprenyl-diphosphatase
VLGLITFAVVGYLFLARKSAVAWLMLGAVLGGVALNTLLKFAFARPRPDFVTHTVRVFTTSQTVLIGLSRIYLGVHYPTDVLEGRCIGAAWAMGCWVLLVWLQNGGQVEPSNPS